MARLTDTARDVLIPGIAACGWDHGMMRPVVLELAKAGEGELRELISPPLVSVADTVFTRIEVESEGGRIRAESVIRWLALHGHTEEMNGQAQLGLDSVALEIPPGYRALAHTGLPIRDGIYDNGQVSFPVLGLVRLGSQEGELFAHLSAVFTSYCSRQFMDEILALQAVDPLFMRMAREVEANGGLDYRKAPHLRAATLRAKEELGI